MFSISSSQLLVHGEETYAKFNHVGVPVLMGSVGESMLSSLVVSMTSATQVM